MNFRIICIVLHCKILQTSDVFFAKAILARRYRLNNESEHKKKQERGNGTALCELLLDLCSLQGVA